MIVAYDHCGIIIADRVPCGTSVTEAYCRSFLQKLRRKMHKNRATHQGCRSGELLATCGRFDRLGV